MGIFYKPAEIDYEKTLKGLNVGESVTVSLSTGDIANLRTRICKIAKRLPAMTFSVNKREDGALIKRVS